ncbi:MAG: hypothetical protein AAF184_06625 [Pseudomonadota bacterium]
MSKSRFLDELKVDELSYGAAMALWSFRVSAVAHARCTCLDPSFQAAFADEGARAREDLRVLVAGLVQEGKRQIWMALPASLEVTCDEPCVLNAITAAQHDQLDGLRAHLRWLLARDLVPDYLTNRFIQVGALLYSHGYEATPPPRSSSHQTPASLPTAAAHRPHSAPGQRDLELSRAES